MITSDRIAKARAELMAAQKELSEALKGNDTRARAPIVRQLHEVRGMLTPGYPYASQAGQDLVIDRALGSKTGGTFVDIGAYDGVTGSNSLYFEKWRGWSGVLVEPVQAMRETATSLRTAACLPYAVSDKRGEARFLAVTEGYTQMSGLLDSYDDNLLGKVRADPRHVEAEITVQTVTIADVLEESGISDPDFISLDIEGGELAALRAFPFEKYRVQAWAIENNTAGPEIAQIMRDNGYNLIEFCGPDEIYLLKTP
ncbi:FkbM family methyltransferase [Yoonia sp. R2331]|uniref:FkbM family methyltransferase n=1 Tax=Yoonia sp. R2331 TaxID=3237238 RepID=UPI0034E4A984